LRHIDGFCGIGTLRRLTRDLVPRAPLTAILAGRLRLYLVLDFVRLFAIDAGLVFPNFVETMLPDVTVVVEEASDLVVVGLVFEEILGSSFTKSGWCLVHVMSGVRLLFRHHVRELQFSFPDLLIALITLPHLVTAAGFD
jgi:hypothetical protein